MSSNTAWLIILGVPLFLFYFLPTIIGFSRGRPMFTILFLNIFLGWSGLGWMSAMAFAVSD